MKHALLISFLALTVSLYGGSEKELRQLHKTAEAAMSRADDISARSAYEALLKKVGPPYAQQPSTRVSWITYVDTTLRLAKLYHKQELYLEGKELLDSLLKKHPPEDLVPAIEIAKAYLLCALGEAAPAFRCLSHAESLLPLDQWKGEDRSFFRGLTYTLNAQLEQLTSRARRFFVAKSYDQAAELFEELLEMIEARAFQEESLLSQKIRCHLAQCYYQMARYEKTLALIEGTETGEEIDQKMLYLAAMAFQKTHAYTQALTYFEKITHESPYYDQALFEMGITHYRAGNRQQARTFLRKTLELPGKKARPGHLALCYLARLDLEEGKATSARALLETLSLSQGDPLRFEAAYLRGETAFSLRDFESATHHFEQCLPPLHLAGPWQYKAVLKLGLCYHALGQTSKAREFLHKLEGTELEEEALLALAAVALKEGKDIEAMLCDHTFTPDNAVKALLLRAEGATTDLDKETFYRLATSPDFAEARTYTEAWYQRGLFYYRIGDYGLAITALSHVPSTEALKWKAQAHFHSQAFETALDTLGALLDTASPEERDEILYLRGLMAAQMPLVHLPIAITSLSAVEGAYRGKALFTLGCLLFNQERYEDAKETFQQAAAHDTLVAGESLFWAAEAAAHLGQESQYLRHRVYEDYPESAHADEAYFKTYASEDYVCGDQKALTHLADFATLFPHSPLLVTAHYLLGCAQPHYPLACASFLDAILAYDTLERPKESDREMRDRARLELAKRNPDLEEAAELLRALVSEGALYEESSHALVQTLLKLGQLYTAQEELAKILDYFFRQGVSEGYYLALAWQEQGKFGMECGDTSTALHCLTLAEECGKKYLSDHERLSLWILQSDCLRQKGDYGTAMRMLSKVINEDVASTLRLKAMYLRAEIYTLQERPELALRQLEALEKKGGDWALKAHEQLKEIYGNY